MQEGYIESAFRRSEDPLDVQLRLREVEDESVVPTYGLQVRAHDGEVGWGELLDGLELHDNLLLDEQVEPVPSHLAPW